jgi:CO/xanthine dehydrogenase FAD-binding subunit
MHEFEYYRPTTSGELFVILQQTGGQVVAGGTDIIPRWRRGNGLSDCLIDISRLDGLRFIGEAAGQIEIGALTTHAGLVNSALLQTAAPLLAQAAAAVGSPQTRQRGTLGGNLVNASPAADLAPALLALNASVRLVSAQGERNLALADFWLGPGKTILAPGEILHSVSFQRPQGRWGTAFSKLGKRNGMAIAVASVAAYLELDSAGKIRNARLALGSLGPKPMRCPLAEAALTGETGNLDLFARAAQAVQAQITPIDDIRASAAYRKQSCGVLVQRVLQETCQQAMRRLE